MTIHLAPYDSFLQELQQRCTELKSREEQLLAEQAKANTSLEAAGKHRRTAEDMLDSLRQQHQQELQAMVDKHAMQLSDVDRTGEESKKKSQQLANQVSHTIEMSLCVCAELLDQVVSTTLCSMVSV